MLAFVPQAQLGSRGITAVVVFGPVADPAGAWGLAVVEADTESDVRALAAADPAITAGLATFEVYPMPGAITRP